MEWKTLNNALVIFMSYLSMVILVMCGITAILVLNQYWGDIRKHLYMKVLVFVTLYLRKILGHRYS